METATARELIALNNRFYSEHAASFSATRQAPWEGWRRVARMLQKDERSDRRDPLTVLDLACGNLRFERFLLEALPDAPWRFHAVDSCEELAADGPATPNLTYRPCDILDALLDTDVAATPPLTAIPLCDLAACFGFMHHVPGAELRQAVFDLLLERTRPGGIAVLSFWQFMDDGRLAAKAHAADALAAVELSPNALAATTSAAHAAPPHPGFSPATLDPGDHFLGWQADERPLRYCHHFTEEELDALVSGCSHRTRELDRFSADGKSGTLNRYLILRKEE